MSAYTRRFHKGAAPATTLTGGITDVATSCSIASATGWPTSVPFVAVLNPGTSAEEKVLVTAASGTSWTAITRGYDDTVGIAHATGAAVKHVVTAVELDEASAMASALSTKGDVLVHTGTVHARQGVGANSTVLVADSAQTNGVKWAGVAFVVSHTWHVDGDVAVPVGLTDFLAGVFVAVPAGQTVKLVSVRGVVFDETSATVTMQVNGSDATGFDGMVFETTASTVNPTDVSLADGDYLAPVVTAVSGTPKFLTVTANLLYTFAG